MSNMANLDAAQSRTRLKPDLLVSTPASIPIPLSANAARQQSNRLALDTFSPVNQNGSFEFDRIIKAGEVLKRTRKTKKWKPIYIVLRPNLLSIYKDRHESKLRHQINLSELTAVARQKDPKRREKHVFGLFSPSRNFHLEATSDAEAHEWVELIRQGARMDEKEAEMYLASPGGASTAYQGFERSIDAQLSTSAAQTADYSSSDVEAFAHSQSLPRHRDRPTGASHHRRMSTADYSGVEHGSYSDFSDAVGPAARMSALSLTDGRPSTSSTRPSQSYGNSVYGQVPVRPSMGARTPSQMSGLNLTSDEARRMQNAADEERVICHGWIHLLKSTSGVRQWKKVWMVLRPKALAIYKNDEEYSAMLILPFPTIIDVVEIDPISKSKTSCMQVISDERNYRFCAFDEESLARWLGAFKSLLSKRKAMQASQLSVPGL